MLSHFFFQVTHIRFTGHGFFQHRLLPGGSIDLQTWCCSFNTRVFPDNFTLACINVQLLLLVQNKKLSRELPDLVGRQIRPSGCGHSLSQF